jgi:M6 family metalloprotease-like protein
MRRAYIPDRSWLLACAVLAAGRLASGGVASPTPFELQQPNGISFMARAWGDEWNNGTETLDGFTIVRAQSGEWVYAARSPGGQLVPSPNPVGTIVPPGLQPRLRPTGTEQQFLPLLAAPGAAPPTQQAPPTAGNHRLLVIVADFTPTQSLGTTEAHWSQYFFAGGSTYAPTSVKNYWDTVSYGALTMLPAAESYGTANNGVVFVTLGYAHPNPVGNTGDFNRTITKDALVAADGFVNFATFDTNADGFISTNELHVYIIVRGYETSFGGSAASCSDRGRVWAHKWSLFGAVAPPTLDTKVVGSVAGAPSVGPQQGGYMQQGEWFCQTNPAISHEPTIGVASHELGHDLGTGLPDLYDTNAGLGTASNGIGEWSVMAGGSWNGFFITGNQGTHPAFPDPWSRWLLGFITPTEITSPQVVAFPQIETAVGANRGVFQLRTNPSGVDFVLGGGAGHVGTGEYFLIENRQLTGYDADLPGAGLLIWHIDESAANNADEGSDPPGNKRIVTLEQADGFFDLECYANPPHSSICNGGDGLDPWQSPLFTTFNNFTAPNSRLWNGTQSGVSITGISVSSANMSATLNPADFTTRFQNISE